jgi:hypothetical protein
MTICDPKNIVTWRLLSFLPAADTNEWALLTVDRLVREPGG